jgi:hypothetical protein
MSGFASLRALAKVRGAFSPERHNEIGRHCLPAHVEPSSKPRRGPEILCRPSAYQDLNHLFEQIKQPAWLSSLEHRKRSMLRVSVSRFSGKQCQLSIHRRFPEKVRRVVSFILQASPPVLVSVQPSRAHENAKVWALNGIGKELKLFWYAFSTFSWPMFKKNCKTPPAPSPFYKR